MCVKEIVVASVETVLCYQDDSIIGELARHVHLSEGNNGTWAELHCSPSPGTELRDKFFEDKNN